MISATSEGFLAPEAETFAKQAGYLMISAQKVSCERLGRRLDRMAEFGARADGGVNRQVYSDADRAARAELNRWATQMGLELYTDPIANQFFRLMPKGVAAGTAPVLTGSHLDSQPIGGRYDGVYGVVAAFEAVQALIDCGAVLTRPIEIVAWSNEEGSRFAPGCMGSMCFTGARAIDEFLDTCDSDGLRLEDELTKTLHSHPTMQQRGFGRSLSSYIELHIEQGPILERLNKPIGLVTGIQGCRWFNVTINGEARHAGTTPLSQRRDALRAAVAYISDLQMTLQDPDDTTRFTIGRMNVTPNTTNTVPQQVSFSIDLRHPDDEVLNSLSECIRTVLSQPQQGCDAVCEEIFAHAAVRFHEQVISAIETCTHGLELAYEPMVSGAFHDALFLADYCPTAMIFVPSQGGISHHYSEFTHLTNLYEGARLLAATLEYVATLSMDAPVAEKARNAQGSSGLMTRAGS